MNHCNGEWHCEDINCPNCHKPEASMPSQSQEWKCVDMIGHSCPVDVKCKWRDSISQNQEWEKEFERMAKEDSFGIYRYAKWKDFIRTLITSRNQELIKQMEQLHSKHQNCGCCSESLWNDVLALIKNFGGHQ